jgi:hypothetical protein
MFLHYAFPSALVIYFFVAQTVSVCTFQTMSANMLGHRAYYGAILTLMLGTAGTYVSVNANLPRSDFRFTKTQEHRHDLLT